jgi:hypothetical protein
VKVDSKGDLIGIIGPDEFNLKDYYDKTATFSETLDALVKAIEAIGGEASFNGRVGFEHWIRFHGHVLPENVAQVKKLLGAYYRG